MMEPRYFEPSSCATMMEVGPSAAPMTAMEAASLRSKKIEARHSVKKMPNCAAAPKIISFGLESSGPKSIIAPMPMNRISGKSSLSMPALNSVISAPPGCTASTPGMLTRIAPKPMGSSSEGSMSLAIAR